MDEVVSAQDPSTLMDFIFGSFSPERYIRAPVDTSSSWFF